MALGLIAILSCTLCWSNEVMSLLWGSPLFWEANPLQLYVFIIFYLKRPNQMLASASVKSSTKWILDLFQGVAALCCFLREDMYPGQGERLLLPLRTSSLVSITFWCLGSSYRPPWSVIWGSSFTESVLCVLVSIIIISIVVVILSLYWLLINY